MTTDTRIYLKVKDTLSELFALFGVRNRLVECTLADTDHLRIQQRSAMKISPVIATDLSTDADAAFVEHGYGILVAFAFFAQEIFHGYLCRRDGVSSAYQCQ